MFQKWSRSGPEVVQKWSIDFQLSLLFVYFSLYTSTGFDKDLSFEKCNTDNSCLWWNHVNIVNKLLKSWGSFRKNTLLKPNNDYACIMDVEHVYRQRFLPHVYVSCSFANHVSNKMKTVNWI